MLYGLAPEALASCSASSAPDPAQRCIYPDTLNGTWNVSLTYASETVITLPHFLEVQFFGSQETQPTSMMMQTESFWHCVCIQQ